RVPGRTGQVEQEASVVPGEGVGATAGGHVPQAAGVVVVVAAVGGGDFGAGTGGEGEPAHRVVGVGDAHPAGLGLPDGLSVAVIAGGECSILVGVGRRRGFDGRLD